MFPHHENEIAQSEAATGKLYANARCTPVRCVSMARRCPRVGNFFTIREVLRSTTRRWCATCWYPATTAARSTTPKTVCVKPRALWSVSTTASKRLPEAQPAGGDEFVARFAAAMDDDFNSPEACAVLFEMIREVNRLRESDLTAAAALAARPRSWRAYWACCSLSPSLPAGAAGKVDAAEVEALIAARLAAVAEKNWGESDRIRDQLTAMGVVLEDGKGGTTWRLAE